MAEGDASPNGGARDARARSVGERRKPTDLSRAHLGCELRALAASLLLQLRCCALPPPRLVSPAPRSALGPGQAAVALKPAPALAPAPRATMNGHANGGGAAGVRALAPGKADKGADFANYFCTYAFLYHQKEMLSDRVRMDAYYDSIFKNTRHFEGKVSFLFLVLSFLFRFFLYGLGWSS